MSVAKLRQRSRRNPSGICRYCDQAATDALSTLGGLLWVCKRCYRERQLILDLLVEECDEG